MNIFKWFFNLISKPKETTFVPDPNVQKRALCVAINDYPGSSNDLQGCINDQIEWAELLKCKYGFQSVKTLSNKDVTIGNVKRELSNIINASNPGDVLVFTYSGHGTSVIDMDGDEADGKDEALCLYDGLWIDDEIRKLLETTKDGVRVTIISDSCFSGSVTRAAIAISQQNEPKARYMPPSDKEMVAFMSFKNIKAKNSIFRSSQTEENMKEVLISGCSNTEVSYDAHFGTKYFGAMSYYATSILNENPGITYNEFYKKLREKLPNSQYPQTPQLEGSAENKNKIMFS